MALFFKINLTKINIAYKIKNDRLVFIFNEEKQHKMKKYNSKATIETILSVSSRLFLEKGFDRTSVQDIAETAKVSKGAIYHHFESKDKIIKAVMDKHIETVNTTMDKLLLETNKLNGREQLSAILERSIENQEIHYFDVALNARIKSAEFVLSYMRSCVNDYAPFVSKIIKKGITDGSINTKYPDECAEVFLLLLNVWCDPAVFLCEDKKLSLRLYFLQDLMASLGIDVFSDRLIEKAQKLLHRLYFKEENKENES